MTDSESGQVSKNELFPDVSVSDRSIMGNVTDLGVAPETLDN